MSIRDQRDNDRREKALESIASAYRNMLTAKTNENRRTYAVEYIALVGMYVTLTGEEEYTVVEYVANHLTEE